MLLRIASFIIEIQVKDFVETSKLTFRYINVSTAKHFRIIKKLHITYSKTSCYRRRYTEGNSFKIRLGCSKIKRKRKINSFWYEIFFFISLIWYNASILKWLGWISVSQYKWNFDLFYRLLEKFYLYSSPCKTFAAGLCMYVQCSFTI